MARFTTHDGLELAFERSGRGTPLVLVHGNGFCKEVWRPVTRLTSGFEAVAVDQRGHGGSQVGPPPFDWWDLGRDLLALIDRLELPAPRVGLGHSSGGAALVMSEILRPGTWDRLVLIEPIIFPEVEERDDADPMVSAARRRRPSFDDRDAARSSFRLREPFARWTDEALELYVEHGFEVEADGRRRLACAPETEAEFYRMTNAGAIWRRLQEVACPVTVIVGTASGTHPPDFASSLVERFAMGDLVSVAGATHFVPMERPDEVARVVNQRHG